ncbi:MAG TPA: hypothetical protein VFC16_02315, partial [Nakamurella sp.]|nr:hypothetical protein [Nakamurella sp.]
SWQDGPTREALMGRAAALGKYRVGAPLPFEDLRFARSSSAVAVALAWPARGSPESPAAARAAIAEVEAFSADTGYPQTRFDVGTRAAAELLRRVGHGDIAEMGALLAQAVPPPRAGRHPRPGPGSDRSGGQFPLANRRTARRVARTRPTPRAWIGHRPQSLPAVRQTAAQCWFSGWPAGEVLQRHLPDSSASRTAPDNTGDRSSLTRSFVHAEPRTACCSPQPL